MPYQRKPFIITFTAILCLIGYLLTGCHFPSDDPSVTAGSQHSASSSKPGSGSDTRPGSPDPGASTNTDPNASGSGGNHETTVTPTPATSSPIIEYLPADRLVVTYFGPLQQPAQTKPVQHHDVRALYIGSAGYLQDNLEIAAETEVNTFILDLKESDKIKYASLVPLALEIGAVDPLYNLADVVGRCHEAGVRVIGRIVCFKDPLLAQARPEYSIRDRQGHTLIYQSEGDLPFANPYCKEVWDYNLDIAREAIALGIDEIQFDYVRFPTGRTESGESPWFGEESTTPTRTQAINRFLQTARLALQDGLGIPVGADVFAIIFQSKEDAGRIGQDWETIGLTGIDQVCPMIYPSHFANKSSGHYSGNGVGTTLNGILFKIPDLEPYNIVTAALRTAQTAAAQEGFAAVRPYIQAFTASYLPEGYYQTYGANEIRAQIEAIRDSGRHEWICWNPRAKYPIEAFDAE